MTHTETTEAVDDCAKYEHIPELYDIAFWHCKICKKELTFITLEELERHSTIIRKETLEEVRNAFKDQSEIGVNHLNVELDHLQALKK